MTKIKKTKRMITKTKDKKEAVDLNRIIEAREEIQVLKVEDNNKVEEINKTMMKMTIKVKKNRGSRRMKIRGI